MMNRNNREYYIVMAPIALAALVTVGCLTTTNHNPMKHQETTEDRIPYLGAASVDSAVAPVTSETLLPLSNEDKGSAFFKLWRLLEASRAAVKAFSEEVARTDPDVLEQFNKTVQDARERSTD